ncbi:helix-turn-helix domain-containing protein [Neolewinella aurantiaca]|uniref:Helix-turn-helix domain-containing protein n=1 Tax=Neolewinella aurantiaca TaxID=2602767 RepID=A0A5C7FKK0_9BACT|nr:helix-turn-helix domain-containing protein [Neolewinella aurantiaca]TXF91213.1 helix-turn-helix domain-containing protein [Neolewinella aurantiaca]
MQISTLAHMGEDDFRRIVREEMANRHPYEFPGQISEVEIFERLEAVTVKQAAKMLRVSPGTVRNCLADGRLEAIDGAHGASVDVRSVIKFAKVRAANGL